jgi:hypothetical protein
MKRDRRWLHALSTALLPTLLVGSTMAQGRSDPAAARALFAEARQLVAEKKYEQACPKFEESQRLDPGIGTLFNLADCWERTGKTASAWARFLDVASSARGAGRADREKVARDRASKLEPKLSKLTILVPNPAATERVSRDGAEIGPAEWGSAVPIDPGEHVIEATAVGKKPWNSTIQVAPNGTKAVVTITIPVLEDQPVVVATPTPTRPVDSQPSSDSGLATGSGLGHERAEASSSGTPQRVVGYVVGVLGLAGIGVGVGFNMLRAQKVDSARLLCTAPGATPGTTQCKDQPDFDQHKRLNDQAKSARTSSIIGFAAGGVALATGIVLVLTAPKGSSSGSLQVLPMVGANEGGLALSGTW